MKKTLFFLLLISGFAHGQNAFKAPNTFADTASYTANFGSKFSSRSLVDKNYADSMATPKAREAISLTTAGTSGAATYSSATGVLNIPNYEGGTWNGLLLNTLQTSSASVTLGVHGLYTYVGSADATFTLPALSSNLNRMYFIKNSSAFNVTVQRDGTDNMFTTTTVTSIVIPAGSSRMIGGTTASGTSYWHVMDLSEGTGSSLTRTTGTTASSATPAPTGDAIFNTYTVTALATNATFGAPTGTPVDQNEIRLRITDNGTSRTLAWNAIYDEGADIALPTATVVNETIYLAFVYNSATSKWQLIGKTGGF